jgi:hypothetical protein
MSNFKVRVNSVYVYHPNLLDRIDGRTNLQSGDTVRVVNLHGCPKANTMGHCHVADTKTGEFIGLVHCNSLHTKQEYIDYLKREIAKYDCSGLKAKLNPNQRSV